MEILSFLLVIYRLSMLCTNLKHLVYGRIARLGIAKNGIGLLNGVLHIMLVFYSFRLGVDDPTDHPTASSLRIICCC